MKTSLTCSHLLAVAALLLSAASAEARNEFIEYEVAAALTAEHHENMLRDVRIFMKGASHPAVERSIGTFRSSRPARSALTSDESACQRAFLSAVISLQQRARTEGGDAVIDIVSDTRGNTVADATRYGCAVGNIVANVGLSGTVVKLAP